MTISDKIRKKRLMVAVERLSPKFGLRTFSTDVTAVAQRANSRTVPGQDNPNNYLTPNADDRIFGNVLSKFVDVTTSVETTDNFAKEVVEGLGQNPERLKRFNELMTIIGDGDNIYKLREGMAPDSKLKNVYISEAPQGVAMLPAICGSTGDERSCVPISIILSKTPQLSLANRNVNACTIFLNGIRSIDMSKAVPYLAVSFEFPLPATVPSQEGSANKSLQAPSLYKFILGGAAIAENSPLSKLANANQFQNAQTEITGSGINARPAKDAYTRTGMEIFTSPQTLVNANETDNPAVRLNPLLDKFRPFMSLKDFSATTGTSGYGTMSYSTAKLSMVLHDKSRLAEIAPFIKADIRGKTRVEIEYGWIHPDGEVLVEANPNYPACIINGMRKKERFQIPTSTYSFNESGEVNIDLNLVTLGTTETQYDLIGIGESGMSDLETLRRAQERIDSLIQATRINEMAAAEPNGRPRLQGLQVINAVSDGFEIGFTLDDNQRKDLQAFISHTRTHEDSNIRALSLALSQLYGPNRREGDSIARAERNRITDKITVTLTNIVEFIRSSSGGSGRDPFLHDRYRGTRAAGTERGRNVPSSGRVIADAVRSEFPALRDKSASLATILTTFIGVPLAKSGKENDTWNEVQMVFYTFNDCAGHAGGKPISSFEIDLGFFQEKYNKFRLENISRTGSMSLFSFWQFLNQELIDDLAAPSYELWDSDGPLLKKINPQTANETHVSQNNAVPADEEYKFNRRLSEILTKRTHNGTWKPPQLELQLENLEETTPQPNLPPKKILRVHIYDKTTAGSESLNAIIAASRQASMTISGEGHPIDVEAGGTSNGSEGEAELTLRRAAWRDTIAKAEAADVAEPIPGTTPVRYRIKGSFRDLKKFVMNNSAYLIPGAQGSLIMAASVGSMQDPNATLQMISNPRPSENINPNNSGDRGLPLYLMPTDVSMDVMGCPLLAFTSQYFIDFNTNTSIDDLWMISGIDHKISEGKFSTNVKFRPVSGYGHYVNYLNQLRDMQIALEPGGEIFRQDSETAADYRAPRTGANRRVNPSSGTGGPGPAGGTPPPATP